MPEAVIVATGRTPIGRANKGSLVDCRPDDLAALVIREVLAKVPELDPQPVEDVIMGSGQPGGEAGYNVGRVAALLAGLPDVPGVTVNRYCSSSLQTIRMAAHAIRAGEGDVFVAAGVETVSRYCTGRPTPAPTTRCSPTPRPAPPRAPPPPASRGRPSRRPSPTSTSPWARRRRTSPSSRTSPARSRTSSPSSPSTGPWPPRRPASSTGRSSRSPLPDGDRGDQGRRAPGRHHAREAGRASSRCSARAAPSPPATPAPSTTAPPPWS